MASPGPSSTPSPKPPTNPLSALLSSHLKSTDDTAAHLRRILTTTSGVDTSLILLGYGSQFLAAQIAKLIDLRLTVLAEKAAADTAKAAARNLSPGETLIATLSLPAPVSKLPDVQASLKTLGGVCSDVRAFMRLWGLLGVWAWGRRLMQSGEPRDAVLKICAWGQVVANAAYLLNEHPVYLATKGIIKGPQWTPQRIKQGYLTAARWFAVHTVFEFLRLYRTWSLRKQNEEQDLRGEKSESKEEKVARAEETRLWWKSLLVYTAYAPMVVHWSSESGVLSDGWYGFLGTCAGILGVREVWRQTA